MIAVYSIKRDNLIFYCCAKCDGFVYILRKNVLTTQNIGAIIFIWMEDPSKIKKKEYYK